LNRKKKAVVFTATIITVALVFVISIFFVIIPSVSSSGKLIKVGVFCKETGLPVPFGLAVTVEGEGYMGTLYTGEDGYTGVFGSGLVDGTYTISWYWNEPYSDTVTIDCSQIVWTFDYCVPNPVIIKHFVYDLNDGTTPPKVGLEVNLYEYDGPVGTLKATATTDATGTVMFGGDVVDVCKDYLLEYTWGGTTYTVPPKGSDPIHFAYTDGKLLVCSWEETNLLDPKDDGDKTLAELGG